MPSYAWTADELRADSGWTFDLSDAMIAALETRLSNLRSTPLDALTEADCALPALEPLAAAVRQQLEQGRGLALIRRLPAERWSEDDLARAYWILGAQIGVGVSQSYKGDRLGHVRDIGEGGRYYTVGGALEMHMDPVDVVGLLCVKRAVEGGESRITASTSVRDAVASDYPDVIPLLERGFHYTSRPQDRQAGAPAVTPHRIPVFASIEDQPASFFLPLAIRNAEAEGAALSSADKDAMALVNTVAQRPELCFQMDLQPGEIQFLNNRLIFHGRSDYEDAVALEDKGHMLRLWLMMPDWPMRPPEQDMHSHPDRAGGGIAATTSG